MAPVSVGGRLALFPAPDADLFQISLPGLSNIRLGIRRAGYRFLDRIRS